MWSTVLVAAAATVIVVSFMRKGWGSKFLGLFAAFILVLLAMAASWSTLINLMMPYAYRPGPIAFDVEEVDQEMFDAYAFELMDRYDDSGLLALAQVAPPAAERRSRLQHIRRFREAGIRRYEGPSTCLQCHQTIAVPDGQGGMHQVDLRDDVTATSHFTFAPKTGFSTFGFNGEPVENFPMGKIDRACGITGTFTWTGWAVEITNAHGEEYSEGCGQCHIVGQYGPISGAMMPFYRPTDDEFAATDCLVCHAAEYDMNLRQVVTDDNGKSRWDHDRRFMAAMSVGRPGAEACLRCHQHNLGGDTYYPNPATEAPGYDRPRLAHPGAKRGTPFGADWDVHAAAGMECLDCHVTRGHKIARGTRGVDLVANDLPDVEISCENCHTSEPHEQGDWAATYNGHTERIACETCHIHRLYPDNLIFRDWSKPVFDEGHGIYVPYTGPLSGEPGEGIVYRWFNGYGTFMANALGDHPDGGGRYRARHTTPNELWDGVGSFDYAADYEETFRPLGALGTSKITPFKRFQAVMYEDLNNQGPYGGMILPIDYEVYYTSGDAVASVTRAMESPIMQKMYGPMFKMYMMDRYMQYMRVGRWNTDFDIERIAPSAMRNDGQLMINHAIQRDGRICGDCHAPDGILDFDELGYPPAQAEALHSSQD